MMNMHSRWITQKNVDQLRAELKDNVEALDFINNRIADGVLILVSAETIIAEVNKEELFGMMAVVQHAGASKEMAKNGHTVSQAYLDGLRESTSKDPDMKKRFQAVEESRGFNVVPDHEFNPILHNIDWLFYYPSVIEPVKPSNHPDAVRAYVVPQEEERRRAIERIHSLSAFLKSFPDGLPEFHSLELVAEGKAVCVRKDGTSVFLTNNTITVLHVEPPTPQ